jgi:putative ABC transport system permease protein
MDTIVNDMRLALRRLVRDPLFSIVAITTLAIGIGANSAIFTLVNGVLIRPLPYAEPDELVEIHAVIDGNHADVFSSGAYFAMRDHAATFDGVGVYAGTAGTFTGEGEPERIDGAAISANYFDVVGIGPLRGRSFRSAENEPGNTMVVLLSEGLWRDRFGADPEIVGRTIVINDRPREVVGVMPAHASFPPEWRYWIPFEYTAVFRDPDNLYAIYLTIVARLKDGVTLEQARAEAVRAFEGAKQRAERSAPDWTAGTTRLHDFYMGDARRPLLVLLGAVGFVLLIACANLANLLLAQAASRSTDFAVRRALGAGAGRLVRQLAVESVVLGLTGGLAGLLLGAWGADALLALMPPELPRVPGLGVDAYVIMFTVGVSLIASFLFGIAPALQARHAALATSLREGGRGVAGRSGTRTRSALVLIETALAFALVIGAGLLIRSFDQLRSVDPGFDVDHALTFELLLPSTRYDNDERRSAFWRSLTERLEVIPGAERAGAINDLPLAGDGMSITFEVEGRAPLAPGEEKALDVRVATPGFFDAMGVRLVRGRLFTHDDRPGAPRVALLSEAAVAYHFPNEDPIGKRIVMGWRAGNPPGEVVSGDVVGIVSDMRHAQLRESAQPEIYFAEPQVAQQIMDVTVRTTVDPIELQESVKQAVREIDPTLALSGLRPMRDVVAASIAADRFMTRLLTAFSAIALVLAAIGIFGVISYGVTQRRREIGVRIAVGASRREVIRLIVGSSLRLAGAGILLGFVASLALTEQLRSLLYGISPADPITFVVAGIVLMAVAAAAALLPAWAASRTPPAAVLNTE